MARKNASRARAPAPPPPNPVPTAYPGKPADNAAALDDALWTACRDILDAVYKAKDGSRRMADIFRELPDEDEYADYYDAIPEPECLDNIATRLGKNNFAHPEDFYKQLDLVFLNAKHYNEEGSQIWDDADEYQKRIADLWRARAGPAGPFSNPEPYHKGKKQSRAKTERASATPAPVTPSTAKSELPGAPPVIHLRVPRPESAAPAPAPVAASPPAPAAAPAAAAPTPATPPQANRGRETRGTRAAAVAANAKMSPVKSTQALPPHQPQQPDVAAAPTGWKNLSPADNAVVAATDAKMPVWRGPQMALPGDPAPGGIPGSGWWGEGSPEFERSVGGASSYKKRIRAVAEAIAAYRDPSGEVLSSVFGNLPPMAQVPYVSSAGPPFSTIIVNARSGKYNQLTEFDFDMSRLFEKARRFFHDRPAEYGKVLTLQRLYNAVTAPYPLPLGQNPVPPPTATLFASLPKGPGNARTVQDANEALRAGASPQDAGFGITTYRIPTKDRAFTEEARHKGVAYRVGDFVHLINPDDASRPIVAQIFKTFVPTRGYPTHHVTVCWYFRPEQTVHAADQSFIENEVFKSAHFCDHPVEDIVEKIAVQPTESAVRGRSTPPVFHPGFPMYVARSRYIERAHFFMSIRKWSTIMPEGVVLSTITNVTPYQRMITLPMVKSPLALGVKGPGAIGRPKRQPQLADEEGEEAAVAYGRSSSARAESRPSMPSARSYGSQPSPGPGGPSPRYQQPQAPGAQAGPSRTQQGQQQPGQPAQARGMPSRSSGQWQAPQRPAAPLYPTRTVASVVGGPQVLEQVAVREYLPSDTAKLFEQDARHQVLWFSGPPLPQGAVYLPSPPNHSLEYLSYLSQRKRGTPAAAARPAKRFRGDGGREAVPAGDDVKMKDKDKDEADADADAKGEDEDEDLSQMWWAQGQTPDEIFAGLRAVASG